MCSSSYAKRSHRSPTDSSSVSSSLTSSSYSLLHPPVQPQRMCTATRCQTDGPLPDDLTGDHQSEDPSCGTKERSGLQISYSIESQVRLLSRRKVRVLVTRADHFSLRLLRPKRQKGICQHKQRHVRNAKNVSDLRRTWASGCRSSEDSVFFVMLSLPDLTLSPRLCVSQPVDVSLCPLPLSLIG